MYRDDIKKLNDHMTNVVNTGYSMKDANHLGGVASLKKELEEKCMGEACKFKNEMLPIVAMINPDMTDLQMSTVEDALHHHKEKLDMIQDAGQKAEAQKAYDNVRKAFEEVEHSKPKHKGVVEEVKTGKVI